MAPKSTSSRARERAARLAGRGYPLKGDERLVDMGVVGIDDPQYMKRIKDKAPTKGEYAAVDRRRPSIRKLSTKKVK